MNASKTTLLQRLYFLDWLRIAAFIVLVIYHVGMYYVTWGYHVKSPFASSALEPFMLLTAPWRMGLLFMVSGVVTALMLQKSNPLQFIRQRSKRLLLPLLCGVVIIVPPQSYYEVVQKLAYSDGFWHFLSLYFQGYKGFAIDGHRLILPTWNHLWFLPYLWIYTMLLVVVQTLVPRVQILLPNIVNRSLTGFGLLLLPVAVLLLIYGTLYAQFPSTHAVTRDWFNHAQYGFLFLLGVAFAEIADIWSRLDRWRSWALGLALLAWMGLISHSFSKSVEALMVSIQIWCAIVASFGFAYQYLYQDHRWRATLTEAVFPVYLLHQTIIIVLSQWLAPLTWLPWLEGPVLIVATLSLSFMGYFIVRKFILLRPWFGLSPPKSP